MIAKLPFNLQDTFFFNYFLFLAIRGLHCWLRAFSRRGEQGLLSSYGARASHCGGFSCCGARARELGL